MQITSASLYSKQNVATDDQCSMSKRPIVLANEHRRNYKSAQYRDEFFSWSHRSIFATYIHFYLLLKHYRAVHHDLHKVPSPQHCGLLHRARNWIRLCERCANIYGASTPRREGRSFRPAECISRCHEPSPSSRVDQSYLPKNVSIKPIQFNLLSEVTESSFSSSSIYKPLGAGDNV